MKGTITNTRKGTRRKRSAQIRRNCKDVETSVGRAGQEHLSYHYYNSPQCDSDSWQITFRNPPLSHSLNMLMALRKTGLGANPQLTRCTECETGPKEDHLDKIAIYESYPRTPPASRGTCEVLQMSLKFSTAEPTTGHSLTNSLDALKACFSQSTCLFLKVPISLSFSCCCARMLCLHVCLCIIMHVWYTKSSNESV